MTRTREALLLLVALLAGAAEPDRLEFGRFAAVTLYRGGPTPAHVALLLSGAGGWDASSVEVARALAAQDVLVVGVDGASYLKALRHSSDPCDYPAGELEALSQFVQRKLARPSYSVPILVGISSGAALAYAALAQAPPNTFRAGLGSDFRAELMVSRPLCPGHGLVSKPANDGSGMDLALAAGRELSWVSIDGGTDAPVRLAAAFAELAARYDAPRSELSADVSDLPLVEIAPMVPAGSALAVILSGDGGWASLDREVGGVLAARGIPVIGLDSLQYFWTRRTPDESAAALERIVRHADATWPGRKLALIGYSRGADVLPFMASRLPAELRSRVALIVLLGPALTTEVEFHVGDWLSSAARADALPMAPEVAKLRGLRILCVYGRDEQESLCRELAPELAMRDERPGDHHFGGDYEAIGARIAQELTR